MHPNGPVNMGDVGKDAIVVDAADVTRRASGIGQLHNKIGVLGACRSSVVVHETMQVLPLIVPAFRSEPPIGAITLEIADQIVTRVTSISIRGCCPLDVHDLVVLKTERGVVHTDKEGQTSIIEVKNELVRRPCSRLSGSRYVRGSIAELGESQRKRRQGQSR